MKLGDSVQTKPNLCLHCGELCDGVSALDATGKVLPKPNDATVCIYCGHLMVFDEALQFRDPTAAEMQKLAGDRRLVAINWARMRL